jgi:ribonuclease P protein subunit RPR2
MKAKYNRKPEAVDRICRERIATLLLLAQSVFSKNPARANRYVEIARKIGMKHKVRLTSQQRKMFCSHCHAFLMPSVNCRVRLRNNKVVYYCKECRHYMRFPYIREKKAARTAKNKQIKS